MVERTVRTEWKSTAAVVVIAPRNSLQAQSDIALHEKEEYRNNRHTSSSIRASVAHSRPYSMSSPVLLSLVLISYDI